MFDTLTDKFNGIFRSLSGRGKISEENIREAMREVRTALLEADVNFQVVNDFVDHVTQKAVGTEVIKSLQPDQLMVKIVYDELVNLMGPVDTQIYFVQPGPTVIMIDTAGRLAIDEELMNELRDVNSAINPHQIYLVLDAMTGQDAVESARRFNEQLELDGLILTKFDSDTRGGALLSAKMVTGKPVKFLGVGEKLDRLEEFRPEGMAQRILGMGDILGLVKEAYEKFDQEETAKLQAKMEKGTFTLDDFMAQMTQIRKLGPMGKIMGMIPGMSELTKQMGQGEGEVEGQLNRMRAIYDSMNRKERHNPDLLDGPRRRRVATGAGVQSQEVSAFIKQFTTARDMMRAVGGMGMMGKLKLMKSMMSGNLAGLGTPGGPMIRTKKSGWMAPKDRNKKKKRR